MAIAADAIVYREWRILLLVTQRYSNADMFIDVVIIV